MKNKKTDQKKSAPVAKPKVTNKADNKKIYRYLIIVGVLILALILSYSWYSLVYSDKIYGSVKIGDVDFSGLSREKAGDLLSDKTKDVEDSNIELKSQDETWTIEPSSVNLSYDVDKTVDKLYSIGRNKGIIANAKERLSLLFSPKYIDAIYEIDQANISSQFSDIFNSLEKPVQDAYFEYKNGQIKIIAEESGTQIDKAKIYSDFDNLFSSLVPNGQLELSLEDSYPKITKEQLLAIQDDFENALSDTITLTSEVKSVTISQDQIASWLFTAAVYDEFDTSSSLLFSKAYATDSSYTPVIEVNEEEIRKYVAQVADEINKDPQDARLSFSDGKVSIYNSPEKGYELDKDAATGAIVDMIITRFSGNLGGTTTVANSIELPLSITNPEVSDQNIDELGIKELIASGTTNFTGSPDNRIHNIKNGASMFNGVIIKPGETLSAISILGNPSAETGYLPELVIKENKTTAEYGGGLCQVSTTLFRAALNAGLEILERTNHSYRVSYYEPPVGMDATVYYPEPDLVIKNNTPAYILIQTEVVGTKITFNLYGTKDGRNVEITDPVVYDTVNPPADKYIESADLPTGTIKRQESSHAGAKATFNYKVTNDGKTIVEKTFNSLYKAWQGIYLYGPGTTLPSGADAQDSSGNKVEDKKDAGGNKCSNECEEGWTECKDGGIRRCNKDGDCLKWSAVTSCGDGQTCSNNQCISE